MDTWLHRVEDFRRHVEDLKNQAFEGRVSRTDRDALFDAAFTLLDPLARTVLEDVNAGLLGGSGTITSEPPHSDGSGGTIGRWTLRWPLQQQARDRFSGRPLQPVTIGAVFPDEWTHPHLAARTHLGTAGLIGWPLQVVSDDDAMRQIWILRAIAEAELHDRIYEADVNWEIVPDA